MPTIKYADLGRDKRLCDIVIAGSHDAGIDNSGGAKNNVQTQNLDIFGQAMVGVRVFDIRIAADSAGRGAGRQKQVELKSFHADPMVVKNVTKQRLVVGNAGTKPMTIEHTTLRGGAFGIGLTAMLQQAKRFLESKAGASEFLLLKFDKCTNWEHIADAITRELNGLLLTARGNLNTMKLGTLAGKAIPLFSKSGVDYLDNLYNPGYAVGNGIFRFVNLATSGGAYNPGFDGLQYYGKGGTSVWSPYNKRSQNEDKQGGYMTELKTLQPQGVLGMMYWTATGMNESIKDRNEILWRDHNVRRFQNLWADGLGAHLSTNNRWTQNNPGQAFGRQLQMAMPNMVLIDFADAPKCQLIHDLNYVAEGTLKSLSVLNLKNQKATVG